MPRLLRSLARIVVWSRAEDCYNDLAGTSLIDETGDLPVDLRMRVR